MGKLPEMKQKNYALLLFVLLFAAAGLLLQYTTSQIRPPEPDIAAVNRLRKETEENWELGTFQTKEDTPYPYAVLSDGGALLYRSSPQVPDNVLDGVKLHMTVLNVRKDQHTVGQLLIDTRYNQSFLKKVGDIRSVSFLFITMVFLLGVAYICYLNRRIVNPFLRLQTFARHVAMGNLDMPLSMDRQHSFGAFTESFDLMREQIREAKRREEMESKRRRELTASLSHDIRTPVTSIKLISELLLATGKEGKTRDKIHSIYRKADQIDHLVTNLLQSSLEDLGELTVLPADESSGLIRELVEAADDFGLITCQAVPPCMIRTDRQRLCQVLDNILYNSYKYAGTPITMEFKLTGRELLVICKDMGKGVPDEELPHLFQKYYRGSNSRSGGLEGSGLGLYIASYLMEKMGGGITCYNWESGFCVELILPLVLPETEISNV